MWHLGGQRWLFVGSVDKTLTRVAVVLDRPPEELLVVVELERSQTFVLDGLFGHDVDGRLGVAPTVPIGLVPLVWS